MSSSSLTQEGENTKVASRSCAHPGAQTSESFLHSLRTCERLALQAIAAAKALEDVESGAESAAGRAATQEPDKGFVEALHVYAERYSSTDFTVA